MKQGLGGCEELPDDWVTTATSIRETGREVFCVSSGQKTDDKEACGWNEEEQEIIKMRRKSLKWQLKMLKFS